MTKTKTLELLNKLDKKLNSMSADAIVDMVISSDALCFFSDDIAPILSTISFSISKFNYNHEFVSWDNFTDNESNNLLYTNYFDDNDLRVA